MAAGAQAQVAPPANDYVSARRACNPPVSLLAPLSASKERKGLAEVHSSRTASASRPHEPAAPQPTLPFDFSLPRRPRLLFLATSSTTMSHQIQRDIAVIGPRQVGAFSEGRCPPTSSGRYQVSPPPPLTLPCLLTLGSTTLRMSCRQVLARQEVHRRSHREHRGLPPDD